MLAAAIWLDVLGDIPQDALEQAFGEWERTETHRPSPAHIVQLARKRMGAGETLLSAKVARAKEWLTRHSSIPDWMDDREIASGLMDAGYTLAQLRQAGFTLHPLRKVVDQ